MQQKTEAHKENNLLSFFTSGITLLILAITAYAIMMFMQSSNNYQTEVSVTSTIQNRVLQLRSDFNQQAHMWNQSSFVKLRHSAQQKAWAEFVARHEGIHDQAIAIFGDMEQKSQVRQEMSKFLALYGDLTRRYQYQKERMELGDEVSFTSKRRMNALVSKANHYLDKSATILQGELVDLTSNSNALMENGSLASLVALALILPMMLLLSAGIYYRQRVM